MHAISFECEEFEERDWLHGVSLRTDEVLMFVAFELGGDALRYWADWLDKVGEAGADEAASGSSSETSASGTTPADRSASHMGASKSTSLAQSSTHPTPACGGAASGQKRGPTRE